MLYEWYEGFIQAHMIVRLQLNDIYRTILNIESLSQISHLLFLINFV